VSLVLDASTTVDWLDNPDGPAASSLFDRVISAGAWVPSLWRLEVANALHGAVVRGRREVSFVAMSLADLETLPIAVDSETDARAWKDTLELARRHKLTLYDAAYLELALRRGLPLASLDGDLRGAAVRENVVVLGE
jgi:predicted nucleic acid-binding protein